MKRQEEINIIAAKLLNDIADATGSAVDNEDCPLRITNKVLVIANELESLFNEPEKTVATEKSTYNVGDKVKVIRNDNGHNFEVGEIIELTEFYDDEQPHWKTNLSNTSSYLSEDEFEAITTDTYKVGDKVVVIDNVSAHDFQIGTVITLTMEDVSEPRWRGKCDGGVSWYLEDIEFEYQQEA